MTDYEQFCNCIADVYILGKFLYMLGIYVYEIDMFVFGVLIRIFSEFMIQLNYDLFYSRSPLWSF